MRSYFMKQLMMNRIIIHIGTKGIVDGADRGDRVREIAPLYLEFIQALTPHCDRIVVAQWCSLWLVAKRTDLWLNRAFDAAEE